MKILSDIINQFYICKDNYIDAERKYGDRDIRFGYWIGCCDIYRYYYTQLRYLECDYYINHLRPLFKNQKLTWKNIKPFQDTFFSQVNSKIVIDSWSNFEFLATVCAGTIFDEEEKKKITHSRYNKVVDLIPDECLGDELKTNLSEQLVQKDYNKTQSGDKFHPLLTKYEKEYTTIRPNLKKDRNFLTTFGQIRNGMHRNYIHYGGNETRKFESTDIIFEDSKPITFNPLEEDTLFRMTVELTAIAKALISAITYKGLLYDPSNENAL